MATANISNISPQALLSMCRVRYAEECAAFAPKTMPCEPLIQLCGRLLERERFRCGDEEEEGGGEEILIEERVALLLFIMSTCPQAKLARAMAELLTALEKRLAWMSQSEGRLRWLTARALVRCRHDDNVHLTGFRELAREKIDARILDAGKVPNGQWSRAEELLLSKAKARVEHPEEEPFHPSLARDLLDLGYVIYNAHHSPRAKRLHKSVMIARILRLLSREEIYPKLEGYAQTFMLRERLEFILMILADGKQRPVLEAAALVALEQELEERWSKTFPDFITRFVQAQQSTDESVLPTTALLNEFGPEHAETAYHSLAMASFQNKRMRLVELIATLDAYSDSTGMERIVVSSYQAIFDKLPGAQKVDLVDRLLRELERKRLDNKPSTWTLLLEPLLLQNSTNFALQERLIDLAHERDAIDPTPYVLFSFEARLKSDRGVSIKDIQIAGASGGRGYIPLLYPMTEETGGFFNRPTARAQAAQEAIDAIIEREGLDDAGGGLSVAQGAGGELSLVNANQGALSLSEGPHATLSPHVEARYTSPSPSKKPIIATIAFIVLAILGALFILLGGG